MSTWIFEPGHTEAEFRARHMMVTWVRGLFKDIRGVIDWDLEAWRETTFQGHIDATRLWTGEPNRDEHLRSADFFEVEAHPTITFDGRFVERVGDTDFIAEANLTIRGHTQPVRLDASYLGSWGTPWWIGEENKGTMQRIGFTARGRIDRNDFGVSWQDELPDGGVVVSNHVDLFLDMEAIRVEDLERTGAIDYYREIDALPRRAASRRRSARGSAMT